MNLIDQQRAKLDADNLRGAKDQVEEYMEDLADLDSFCAEEVKALFERDDIAPEELGFAYFNGNAQKFIKQKLQESAMKAAKADWGVE